MYSSKVRCFFRILLYFSISIKSFQMKNNYGLNLLGMLIHIDDVDKNMSEKYFCLQCKDELIARKGKINRHHFSHKNIIDCNFETYLHKLGKIKFFNLYKNCLENKIPFYTDYEKINICNTCSENKNYNMNCFINSETGKIDLTTIFDQVYLEKNHDGFIADVLLKSSKIKEVIFIEIWVTHQCEKIKIESGNRIIEIKLEEEVDLDFLNNNYIHQSIANCRFYNFKIPKIKKNFIQIHDCYESIDLFTIFKSGKAISREVIRKNLEKELQKPNAIYNKIENYNEEGNAYSSDFISSVEEASKKGIKFKNCYACRFWALNSFQHIKSGNIFCKRKKEIVENSNEGFNCDKFWRIE
jgi:hypothetical protein